MSVSFTLVYSILKKIYGVLSFYVVLSHNGFLIISLY